MRNRCPQCETAPRTAESGAIIGRPFDPCPACGQDVARPRFNEWDLMTASAKSRVVTTFAVRSLVFGLAPVLLYGGISAVRGGEVQRLTLLSVLGGGLVLSLFWWASRLKHDVRRSRRRMSDPMYLARLMKFAASRPPDAI